VTKEKFMEPGTYIVRATIRQTVTVEPGEKRTETEVVDEALLDPGSELVDWEIEGKWGES